MQRTRMSLMEVLNHRRAIILAALVITLVWLGLTGLQNLPGLPRAYAQSGGGYDLTWSTIDGGGGTSTGGAYSLTGTVGQPDARVLSGGSYTLGGGFQGGGSAQSPAENSVYLPIILKSY